MTPLYNSKHDKYTAVVMITQHNITQHEVVRGNGDGNLVLTRYHKNTKIHAATHSAGIVE